MENSNFDPFQSIETIKAQGYDSGDLRNFAFRGLESFSVGEFANFVFKHENNESFRDLIELNTNMGADEAFERFRMQPLSSLSMEKAECRTHLVDIFLSSANQFYSQRCEEMAEIIENEKNHTHKRR